MKFISHVQHISLCQKAGIIPHDHLRFDLSDGIQHDSDGDEKGGAVEELAAADGGDKGETE